MVLTEVDVSVGVIMALWLGVMRSWLSLLSSLLSLWKRVPEETITVTGNRRVVACKAPLRTCQTAKVPQKKKEGARESRQWS